MMYQLESRLLNSSNVIVTEVNGLVSVRGDSAANFISVTQTTNGVLKFTGDGVTTINGKGSYTSSPITQYITVNLGSGDDNVLFQHVKLTRSLKIQGGDGNDLITLKHSRFAASDIYGGNGNDTVAFADVSNSKFIQISGDDGTDTVGLSDVIAEAGFSIGDSRRGGNIGLKAITSTEPSWISTSNGNDKLVITASTFGTFSAKLRGGDDTIITRDSEFNGNSTFDGGSGKNNISRQVVEDSHFPTSANDYNAGIAGVPYEPTKAVSQLYAEYGGSFGLTTLPQTSGSTSRGFLVNARGTQFQTFGYVWKQLNAEAGIVAGQQYSLTFTVDFVATIPDPASTLNFYVGASPIDPKQKIDGNLNIHREMSQAGFDNTSSNTVWSYDPSTDSFSFTHKSPLTAVATSSGTLNIVIGANFLSGAIAGGSTPNVYFTRIKVSLTPI